MRSERSGAVAVFGFALVLALAGCSVLYSTESMWKLGPIEDPAERDAAAQRMAAVLARDPETIAITREGNVVRATLTGDAAEVAWAREDALVDLVLAPPVRPGWNLRVKTRLVTVDGVRWFEQVFRPPESRPAR